MALRQGSPPYVCFYSNKCDWSEAFLKELKQTPYTREFQFVCVDTTPRAQLPTWLKQVPTLLIRDDKQEPIKTNSEVMNWLFARKLQDGSRGGGGANIGGGSPAAMSGAEGAGGEPDAWNVSEMGKLSDSYGVILDGNSATVGSSSSGNWDFGFLNGNAATGSRTASDIGQGPPQEAGQKKSKKQELMDREFEQFMQNRDRGMPQMRRPMPGGGAPGGGNNGQMPLR